MSTYSIPKSVISIGDAAFSGCTSLVSITIPESVTRIGEGAFADCPKLTLYGTAGSEAERYAKEEGIPFVVK